MNSSPNNPTTPSPSAPALRAAQTIVTNYDVITIYGGKKNEEEVARVIDEATGLPELIAAIKSLESVLVKVLRNLSNVEALGEWEALEINRTLRKTTRAKVDEVVAEADQEIIHARAALSRVEQRDTQDLGSSR